MPLPRKTRNNFLGFLTERNGSVGREEELGSDPTNDEFPWLVILTLDGRGILHTTHCRVHFGYSFRHQKQQENQELLQDAHLGH